MPDSDPRVQKCLLTCANATREGGQKKNQSFETTNSAAKKFLEEYGQNFQKQSGSAGPATAQSATPPPG